MDKVHTYQGSALYLQPEGLFDASGHMVMSKADILAGLSTPASEKREPYLCKTLADARGGEVYRKEVEALASIDDKSIQPRPDEVEETMKEIDRIYGDGTMESKGRDWGLMRAIALMVVEHRRRVNTPTSATHAELIRDLAEHGTRFDLNPTIAWHDEQSLASGFLDYLKRIDESIRERAAGALADSGANRGI